MALLLQTDYDQLAPQLYNKKRTAGGNSGKTIKETEITRGVYQGSPPTPGAVGIRIIYTDNTSETLVYAPYVDTFPAGSIDLKASANTP